jgi:ferrous iron transport protein B
MKIALVGNQNCGKTTLFNLLTGMNQKIGNWPGVTIEKKSGLIKDGEHELIDLPGIYSLNPYSEEEKISRDFVLNKEADLIINVIDVTSIERSLYLTTQLMEIDIPIIVVLNMADLLDKKGITVDVNKLEKELGVKVIKVSALKKSGISELMVSLNNAMIVRREIFDNDIEEVIKEISKDIESNKRFLSVKALERDKLCKKLILNNKDIIEKLEKRYNGGLDSVIADKRYKYINEIKEKCFIYRKKKESVSDKLDKIFLNRWLALPIFTLIMFGVYYLSVGVIGSATVETVDSLVGFVSGKLRLFLDNIGTSSWLISLIVEGMVAGIGAVLNFIPQLIILFLCISILETSGYMSRIAFFLDMIFKKFGLSGKTLVPFIVGSGCSVPGIMATRTIENKEEREMSIVLTPFIPCSAKLPIIALFAEFFFPNKSGVVSASLYFLAIMVILLLALILKKFVYKGESNTFISELPEYKVPSVRYVLKDVSDKVFAFIKRAGSVILIASIVVWFLLSFSFKLEYGVDIDNSILANIGKCFSWVFYPFLGELSWEATVSAIQGLVAKEQVVGSMAIIANMSEESLNGGALFTSGAFGFFTSASAYAYVVFNLFSAPCFGAIGAMRKELGGLKKTLLVVLLQVVVAWVISVLVYMIGTIMIGG